MRLPYLNFKSSALNRLQGSEVVTSVFGGINEKVVAGDGEFSAMKNMSCREYPAICTRKPRSTDLYTVGSPNGMFFSDGNLFYIDGTKIKKNGTNIPGDVTDTGKLMAKLGAKMYLFPEGKAVNLIPGSENVYYNFIGGKSSVGDVITFAKDTSEDKTWITAASGYPFEHYAVGDYVYIFTNPGNTEQTGMFKVIGVKNEAPTPETVSSIEVDGTVLLGSGGSARTWTLGNGECIKKLIPEFDLITEANNRVWACRYGNQTLVESHVNEIYSCKLGDPSNWYSFDGVATDSYTANIGKTGEFTGAINFNGYPLFMKEDCIITIYGDKPSNFSITTKDFPGTKYNDSMVVINQVLYYVASDGVYAYNGVSPTKISENILQTITHAKASTFDNKYYLSCLLGGQRKLLVYDTEKGIWDIEDGANFVHSCVGNKELYYIDTDNKVRKIEGSATTAFDWMLESVDAREGSLDMKYVAKLKFNLWLDSGTEVTVYMKYDNDAAWTRAGAIKATKNTTYTIPIIPKRCNKYRWKITGTGQGKLLAVGRTVMGGSERDGNIQI